MIISESGLPKRSSDTNLTPAAASSPRPFSMPVKGSVTDARASWRWSLRWFRACHRATGLLTGTQRASPRRVLGWVLSLIGVAQALGQGTGILLAGLLSSTVSLTVLLNLQASCYLACAVVAAVGFAPSARRTESDAPAATWTTTRTRKPDGSTNALGATQPAGVGLGNAPGR